jgi:hypothetical protein
MTGFISKRLMAQSRGEPLSDQDRMELEEFLVDEDFDYIMNSGEDGRQFLRDILLLGHKGFADYDDQDLVVEAQQREIMKEPE